MGKLIWIISASTLIFGILLGFIIGALTVINVGTNFAEDFIEENGVAVMPALVININQTTFKDYTKDIINESEIKDSIIDEIKERIKGYEKE